MKRSCRAVTAFVMVFLLAASMLTACGGGSSGSAAMNETMSYNSAVRSSKASSMPSGLNMADTVASSIDSAGGSSSEEAWYDSGSAAPQAAQAENGAPEGPDSEALANTSRKLIRTVDLRVETTEFDGLMSGISKFVTDCGGYIERSSASGNSKSGSSSRYASVTARIPADKVDAFLSQMDEQSNITYRSENVEDVTLQYTDVESRKKSLTIEQERLWELLEKADSLDAVISLEERLSEIRYELERMESQLRTYDNQVDYSTVYIDIDEVGVFTPVEPDSVMTRIQKGFTRNLQAVSTWFVDFFVWFVSSLPTLVVLAAIAALTVWITLTIIKHATKKPTRKKADKAAPAQGLPKEAVPTAEAKDEITADNEENGLQ